MNSMEHSTCWPLKFSLETPTLPQNLSTRVAAVTLLSRTHSEADSGNWYHYERRFNMPQFINLHRFTYTNEILWKKGRINSGYSEDQNTTYLKIFIFINPGRLDVNCMESVILDITSLPDSYRQGAGLACHHREGLPLPCRRTFGTNRVPAIELDWFESDNSNSKRKNWRILWSLAFFLSPTFRWFLFDLNAFQKAS